MITTEKNPLLAHARNEYSQNGEDGILEKIFELLHIKNGWCAELGAWDGKKCSNTYHLITQNGWSGVMIEADKVKFKELTQTYAGRSDVHCVQQFVGFDPHDNLDAIFKRTPIPVEFDLLSLDIDGNDYHLWDSMKTYRPKVVVIEYNQTIPNEVSFIQPRDMRLNQGSSLLALVTLARTKGYQLIATTETNAFFVLDKLFPLFGIKDNSLNFLRPTAPFQTYIFQLYDGTLVLHGNKKLLWCGTPIREESIQIVPKPLRFFRSTHPVKKFLRKLWTSLVKRNIVK
jgi:hypothetical protein